MTRQAVLAKSSRSNDGNVRRKPQLAGIALMTCLLAGCSPATDGPFGATWGDGSGSGMCKSGRGVETAIFGWLLTNESPDDPVLVTSARATSSHYVVPGSLRVKFNLAPESDDSWIGSTSMPFDPKEDIYPVPKLERILAESVEPADAVIQPGQTANVLVMFSAAVDRVSHKQWDVATVDEVTISYRAGGRDYVKVIRPEMMIAAPRTKCP